MFGVARALLIGSMASLAVSTASFAIEPQAPDHLMTAEEATVILARQHLQEMKQSAAKDTVSDYAALAMYYANYDGPPLWIGGGGLSDKAKLLIAEIAQADQWGLEAEKFRLPDLANNASTDELVDAEVTLSLAILKYARYARGGRMVPKNLSFAIDRTPEFEKPDAVLNALRMTDDPAAYLRGLHPQHDQFTKLRQAYLKALSDEQQVKPKAKNATKAKIKLSQRILYNVEMWRWMPRELGQKYVWSNIPEFKVQVVHDGRIVHDERIVAGKIRNKTPIFSDEMETIVFHPFWGVPNSIKVKEILPSLVRGGDILKRQNLRISYGGREIDPSSVDWSQKDIRNFHVFQPPGRGNALGLVKSVSYTHLTLPTTSRV